MWADAGIVPLVGSILAQVNRLRWSSGSPQQIAEELEAQAEVRPVTLKVAGQSYSHQFADPMEAATWIREAASDHHPGDSNVVLAIGGKLATAVAEPALAVFCRLNSTMGFPANNIFSAAAFARRAIHLPLALSREQTRPGCHPRMAIAWEDFEQSEDRQICAFVEAATKQARPEEMVVMGKEWRLERSGKYWVVYLSEATAEAVMTFKAGDGGSDDAKNNPGSPAYSYVQGLDDDEFPESDVPIGICRELAERGQLTVVGYSQGGIPAMACTMMCGAEPGFTRTVLFNCATMFWPEWLNRLFPDDWWPVSYTHLTLPTKRIV
eukprot:TRINITY_DN43226_c0_g2_i1.p1 TRINITY_DN43226_c0_g2~~TRINITY_DN43226_c0_g2_i1.p1  ORF type:complete len:323 (-),score=59.03 TRINITY_DN43226_c0_g2_i1:43-1011(-)